MNSLKELTPQPLFTYFSRICEVPRPSKKEEKIRQFLLDFAQSNGLEAKTDAIGNVLILKPATPGYENAPVVILQTHMDMVCEKNSDKDFDFDNDPIVTYVEDGWVKADGTTLGADCGIGIAAQMAVLTDENIKHPAIECLITVDEETGLTGANELQAGFLKGSILLNLDSEDEGEIFIGCAGGIDTLATLTFQKNIIPENAEAYKISITGLLGGHSGDDIHKNRGNAIKILTRLLLGLNEKIKLEISEFDGGNLRNAIAREAFAQIVVDAADEEKLKNMFNEFEQTVKSEYQFAEPGLKLNLQKSATPAFIIDPKSKSNLLLVLTACPHGVLEMSTRMERMVETSTNLASVKIISDNEILITTSQRSEIESRRFVAADMVKSVFQLAGAAVKQTDGYPGWTPNPNSAVLKTTVESYIKLFGNEPVVRSIHAGLECGLFLEKYPHLDMVSFGPTIRGAHSPDERLDIKATEKFWKHLVDVLEQLK